MDWVGFVIIERSRSSKRRYHIMKLLRALILAILLILPGTVLAGEWCRQSETKTADAAITTSGGVFHGVIVVTDGSDAVTMSIYDNASAASGDQLIVSGTSITTSATDRIQAISIEPPVRYHNGVYVDITCSGTVSYMVYYEIEK